MTVRTTTFGSVQRTPTYALVATTAKNENILLNFTIVTKLHSNLPLKGGGRCHTRMSAWHWVTPKLNISLTLLSNVIEFAQSLVLVWYMYQVLVLVVFPVCFRGTRPFLFPLYRLCQLWCVVLIIERFPKLSSLLQLYMLVYDPCVLWESLRIRIWSAMATNRQWMDWPPDVFLFLSAHAISTMDS